MTDGVVTTVDTGSRTVSRRVIIDAPVATLFALVADPHRHRELDGSGTIRDIEVVGPDRLSEGARFTVGMKQYGVPYKIRSTVTEFRDDAVVEWQHPMGHRWRWEFTPISPDRTQVTETFDYSTAKAPTMLEIVGEPKKNAAGITATLQALAERFRHKS